MRNARGEGRQGPDWSGFCIAAVVAVLAAPAFAQLIEDDEGVGGGAETIDTRLSPEARLVVPLDPDRGVPLGQGWHAGQRRFVSRRGACIQYAESTFEPRESVHAALETLSRAGGHLRVGLHIATHRGIESIEGARLVDAARRLARQDAPAFRALCGDVFVAGTVAGAQWVGEFEIDSRNGNAAHLWLQRRGLLGVADDLEALVSNLETFVENFPVHAQLLPDGRRSAAQPIAAETLLVAAREFPESAEASVARPYLGLLLDYAERMRSGLPVSFALPPPQAPGRAVFAAMRPRRSAVSDMHLARPDRRPPPLAPVAQPVFRVERFPVRVVESAGIAWKAR